MLASTGYEVQDRSYRSRLSLRWVPSPRYNGSIELALAPQVDGPYTVGFRPSSEVADPDLQDRGSRTRPTFQSQPQLGARFRRTGNSEVEADGRIVNTTPDQRQGRTVAFRFPSGDRPRRSVNFDLACESGFTVATVESDGSVLLDPHVGWIDLHGLRFETMA
jgi:hypothetical protein